MQHDIDYITNFAHNAVYLRKQNGLRQKELSVILGIKRCSIGAIEEGRAVGIDNLIRYSLHFGVSIDDLVKTQLK